MTALFVCKIIGNTGSRSFMMLQRLSGRHAHSGMQKRERQPVGLPFFLCMSFKVLQNSRR